MPKTTSRDFHPFQFIWKTHVSEGKVSFLVINFPTPYPFNNMVYRLLIRDD